MATKIVTKNSSTASAVPTASDLVQGELAVNVADKRLFTEDNAGAIVELGTNPSTLTVTGEITANGGIALGDNDKATFGAGDDLQIYHDGSNSYIDDAATGHLFIRSNGDGIYLRSNTNEEIAHFNVNGSVKAYYDNSLKLATTSTGIDVTGTATMDGLTVSSDSGGPVYLQDSNATATYNISELSNNAGNFGIQTRNSSGTFVSTDYQIVKNASGADYHRWFTQGSERLRIDSSGNVGIGVSAPTRSLVLGKGDSTGVQTQYTNSTTGAAIGDGFTVGIDGSENAEFWNFENTNMLFATNGTERMRIDASGNVGIGTSSPAYKLDVVTASPTQARFAYNSTNYVEVNYDGFNVVGGSMVFENAGTERMRLDTSGNLLVGKTTTGVAGAGTVIRAGGELFVTRAGDVMNLNRLTSDGEIAVFRKDGASVGSIGTLSGTMYIGNGDCNLLFTGATDQMLPVGTNGATKDGQIDLGSAGNRFDDIFATNGTIQTSDRNEKQDIAELSDAEQRVAVACKGLLRKFRWKSSVAEKGDEARTHFGIIAQDLQAAFAAEGLDAGEYAMFISTTWTDEETNEEKTRMGVRYSELLAFIISAI